MFCLYRVRSCIPILNLPHLKKHPVFNTARLNEMYMC